MHFTDNRHYCFECIRREMKSPESSESFGWLAMGVTSELVKQVEELNAREAQIRRIHAAVEKLAEARNSPGLTDASKDITKSEAATAEDARNPTAGGEPNGNGSGLPTRLSDVPVR